MATFQVQARVLDLLGADQIADLPTAVSELFKNSYDAYADRAIIDIHRDPRAVIVWDDGFGMSEADLRTKWLTVGTSTKRTSPPAPPPGRRPRAVMGEKGIGRLAISRLGSSLLLVTRMRVAPADQMGPWSALFVNWNVARNLRLRLSDVEIPVVTFDSLQDLDAGIVATMVDEFRRSITRSDDRLWAEEGALRTTILAQLDAFKPDLSYLSRTGITDQGTAFYIADAVEDIGRLLARDRFDDGEESEKDEFVLMLSNFTNTFGITDDDLTARSSPTAEAPFRVDVRRWTIGGRSPRSLFDDSATFTGDDLRTYDHRMDIHFDEFGRYSGVIETYGTRREIPALEEQRRDELRCGPFHFSMWYWQGTLSESRLSEREHAAIGRRLAQYGGILMYRNGMRVLPYGRPEFDWLRFEERRSKSAERYHFSYRRMFGFVEIDSAKNPELRDKAGREGLIINAAYRDLRNRLMEFLSEAALRHFGRSESYRLIQKDAVGAQMVAAEAERRVGERRTVLKKDLAQASARMLADASRLEELETAFRERVATFVAPDADELDLLVERTEAVLREMESAARVKIPKDLSLGRDVRLRQGVADHERAFDSWQKRIAATRADLVSIVANTFPEAERRRMLQRQVEDSLRQARLRLGQVSKSGRDEVEKEAATLLTWLDERGLAERQRLDTLMIAATGGVPLHAAIDAGGVDVPALVAELERRRSDGESVLRETSASMAEWLRGFVNHKALELSAAQSSEVERLREQVQTGLELAQIGMTVEMVDHQLQQAYHGMRDSLRTLRIMLKRSETALREIATLQGHFEHLETQYAQLQPLYRSGVRSKSDLTGLDIFQFITTFLGRALRTNAVRLEGTPAFRGFRVHEARRLLIPVFINLVDNAIYWLRKSESRRIVLDVIDGVVTVCDSGPGIHEAILEDIFEAFVTTKPSGRGLGLFIARESLAPAGHKIWATNDERFRRLRGACFCVRFSEDSLLNEAIHD